MTKEQKIGLVSTIILIGFTLEVFYHYVLGGYMGLPYPFNTFLYLPEDRWMDFIWPYALSLDPYTILRPSHQNFPFLYKIASGFRIFGITAGLFTFVFLFWASFAYFCMRELRTENQTFNLQTAFILCFLSYPVIITLDRANFEALVFVFLYFYIFYYHKRPTLSAIALGCAIALKAFPALLAILLLADKRYKQLMIATFTPILLTIISYATLPGGISANIVYHLVNLKLYTKYYAIDNLGLYFSTSIWGALKFIAIWTNTKLVNPNIYTISSVLLLIIICCYIIFIEKTFWKKVALAVCALDLLPMVSADYKLLHLFIPLFLFINTEEKGRYDIVYATLFSLTMIPKSYYHLPAHPEATLSILLNPIFMSTIVAWIFLDRQGAANSQISLQPEQSKIKEYF